MTPRLVTFRKEDGAALQGLGNRVEIGHIPQGSYTKPLRRRRATPPGNADVLVGCSSMAPGHTPQAPDTITPIGPSGPFPTGRGARAPGNADVLVGIS